MVFHVVHKGIDSIYLSFKGTFNPKFLIELEKKKSFAQSDNEIEKAKAVFHILSHCFEVKDRGKGVFKYVMVDNWFHIQMAGNLATEVPAVYVQVSSELINCKGIELAIKALNDVLSEIMYVIEEGKVSRVDIFSDFVTDRDFSLIEKVSWITRAKSVRKYWEGQIFTGWKFGERKEISGRLYDKTVELEESLKYFFRDIWLENGWDEIGTVWRFEVELRRSKIRELLGKGTYEELILSLNNLWKYCTHDWLRLGLNDGTKNRSRWGNDPIWEEIQNIRFGDGLLNDINLEAEKKRLPNEGRLYKHGMGYIVSFAAMRGIHNLDDAVFRFYKESMSFLQSHARLNTRYSNASEYLMAKLHLKEREFNNIRNDETSDD